MLVLKWTQIKCIFSAKRVSNLKTLKHMSIKIPETTLEKFRYVAKYDDRDVSKQIMYLIHKSIRDFEAEHGKIELPEKEEK